MGEDDHSGSVRSVVAGIEQSAEHRAKTHDIEIGAAHDAGLDDARFAEADHREFNRGKIAERADGSRRGFEVLDFGYRERGVLHPVARSALADVDETVLVAIHEWSQQYSAHHAEDRGVGADAERQRDHDGRGKSLCATKRSNRDAHVLAERYAGVEPAAVPDTSHRIADRGDVAEFP